MTDSSTSDSNLQRRLFTEIPARPLLLHPRLVERVGIRAAALACQLLYWQSRKAEGQFIFKTESEFQNESGLSAHEQRTAIGRLEALGWLTTHRRDIYGRRNFRIDVEAMLAFLSSPPSRDPAPDSADQTWTPRSSTPPASADLPLDEAKIQISGLRSANTEMTAEKTEEMTQRGPVEPARNGRALDRLRTELEQKGILSRRPEDGPPI